MKYNFSRYIVYAFTLQKSIDVYHHVTVGTNDTCDGKWILNHSRWSKRACFGGSEMVYSVPDSKVHAAHTGPTWVLSAQDWPDVGPMNLAIRGRYEKCTLQTIWRAFEEISLATWCTDHLIRTTWWKNMMVISRIGLGWFCYWWACLALNGPSNAIRYPLTHWGRNKMDAISQTTFWGAFSWMKMFEFRVRFHWNLFLRVQLTIIQHRFR